MFSSWIDDHPRQFVLCVVAAFFVLSGVVYGGAVTHSTFVRWDDGMLVYENPAIREISPSTVKYIFSTYDPELYIPLTFLTYQIDYQIGGIQPLQYHLTNFLFFTLNGLLLAWFVTLFFKKRWLGIICGLLFLMHPLHTEAIMWVSGRKDLLSGFFFLLTLIFWLRWRNDDVRRLFIAAVGFFALALLSKIMAVTLPVILLLLDWREARGFSKEMFTEKIPFFALSILFGIIGLGGKTSVVASTSTWEKMVMAAKSSMFYVQKIVWPDFFSLLYPYHKSVVITSPDFFIPIILWIVIFLLIAGMYARAVRGARDIAFGVAFFFITVAPTFLNFTKGGDLDVYFASDRYAYLPSIGILIAVIALVLLVEEKGAAVLRPYMAVPHQFLQKMMVIIACLVIGILGFLSYRQSQVWLDTYTLLTHVLQYYPDTTVAHNNLGNVYRFDGKYQESIDEYNKALAIRVQPKTLSNLGAAYRALGQYDEAIATYEKALTIDPNSKDAHFGLGIVYAALKEYGQAEAEYQKAIALDPTYEEVFTDLGVAYYAEGKVTDAVTAYRRALAINPFFTNAHYNLAIALTDLNQTDEAIAEYQLTVREVPNSVAARINLALLLYKSGDQDGARQQFEQILRIDPNNPAANKALQQMGT